MTKRQRLYNFIAGIGMLALAVILELQPELGCDLIVGILCVSLLLHGIRQIVYYFSMARFMVGGKRILHRGILFLDIGIFTVAIAAIPRTYVLLYLLGYNLFVGVVEILRALEARKLHQHSHKLKLVQGILNVLLALVGLFFMKSESLMISLYCTGLVTSALERIGNSFKKTAIVYIQ